MICAAAVLGHRNSQSTPSRAPRQTNGSDTHVPATTTTVPTNRTETVEAIADTITSGTSDAGGLEAESTLPLYRLHLMRVGYLVMGVGLAVVKWPLVIGYDRSMPLFEGVVAVLLTAMSLLAFLGLRYPIRLLPILLFEVTWKLIWWAAVALPALAADDMDSAMKDVMVSCLFVIVILAVVPWRYVWRHYVKAEGDRWR